MHINIRVSSIDPLPTDVLESNLKRLIENNQPHLDLSNVYIYFSDDTLRDVVALQKDKGLTVKGQSQHAIGKALHYIEKGELCHAIVLDYDFFSPFIFKDIDEAFLQAFLINHELGHIFEYNLTSSFMPLNDDFESVVASRKEMAHYLQSKINFSEYMANTFAINTLRIFDNYNERFYTVLNHFYNLLHNYIKEIPQLIEESKNEVISSRNGTGIQNISYRLFYFKAQIIGLFEGVGAIEGNNEGLYQDFLQILRKNEPLYIVESFEEMAYALHTALRGFNNLEDYTFLTSMNKVIDNFWLKCGFESDDLLYFKVI